MACSTEDTGCFPIRVTQSHHCCTAGKAAAVGVPGRGLPAPSQPEHTRLQSHSSSLTPTLQTSAPGGSAFTQAPDSSRVAAPHVPTPHKPEPTPLQSSHHRGPQCCCCYSVHAHASDPVFIVALHVTHFTHHHHCRVTCALAPRAAVTPQALALCPWLHHCSTGVCRLDLAPTGISSPAAYHIPHWEEKRPGGPTNLRCCCRQLQPGPLKTPETSQH